MGNERDDHDDDDDLVIRMSLLGETTSPHFINCYYYCCTYKNCCCWNSIWRLLNCEAGLFVCMWAVQMLAAIWDDEDGAGTTTLQ